MADVVFQRRTDGYVAMLGEEQVAVAYTQDRDGLLVFTHTEVDPDYEGQHLGSRLAKEALDDVRERGLRIVPQCPFISHYIEKHPEYSDLAA